MVRKVGRRFHEWRNSRGRGDPCARRKRVARDTHAWMVSIDPELAKEAADFRAEQYGYGRRKVDEVSFSLGGGGAYALLSILTRRLRPRFIVDTGVAAGFSSLVMLIAMQRNGQGRLYSSEFPYFRVANPEKYVGYMVEDSLRDALAVVDEGRQ